jgi:hypothetical protein
MLNSSMHSRIRQVLVGCAVAVGMAGCAGPTAPLTVMSPASRSVEPLGSRNEKLVGNQSPPAAAAPAHIPTPRTGPGGSTFGAKHGGLVLDDQGVRIELDAQPGRLTLYLTENDGVMSTLGATGHITLLSGVNIDDAYLVPSAEHDRLTVSGNFRFVRGTQVVVRVALPDGRRLNTRFLIII